MKIYVSHARRSDFENELYKPLRESNLNLDFIFPHENDSSRFDVRELFEKKKIGMVLAEVSNPATGQGIELAWANANGIPIVCIYKKGSDIAGSLKFLTDKFIEYENSNDMINKIKKELNHE